MSARFLIELWRRAAGADARSSFGETKRFGLWESPTGLYFFDPPLEGDGVFYESFYRHATMRRYLHDEDRVEFQLAAAHVKPDDRVLDVGCGFGPFRSHVPEARYTGLDPFFSDATGESETRRESLGDHLGQHADIYDVVTAFQVMEHVARPVAFLTDLARAAKPGGTVIVGVPHVEGAHTAIPNYLVNAVPHHLTWWTPAALEEAAARAGLVNPRVVEAGWSRGDAIVFWMAKASFVTCGPLYHRHALPWHASAALAALLAVVLTRIMPVPQGKPGISLLMVAERPA